MGSPKGLHRFFLSLPLLLTANANSLAPAEAVVPNQNLTSPDIWARFCNDGECQEGCGTSVLVTNTACFTEHGRKSFMIHGTLSLAFSLQMSPYLGCYCTTECLEATGNKMMKEKIFEGFDGDWSCHDISDWAENMETMKFVTSWCQEPSCPESYDCDYADWCPPGQ